jgi:hypothetical protein
MSAPAHIARENGKKGGRPKGTKDPQTLEREKVQEAINQRVFSIADSLITPQVSIAKGQQFLYKIEKTEVVGPKGGVTYKAEKPQLVTDEWEVQQYVDSLVDKANGDLENENDPSATYYYITTKEPNNMAIDSLLNRTLGKPKESLDVTSKGEAINNTGFSEEVINEAKRLLKDKLTKND